MGTLATPATIPPASRRGVERITLRKALWFAAGWVCFGVGAIGVALPGIPTTGPMILALACFARSSRRFHDWLYHHRLFGPPLQRWKRDRIIPLRAKFLALGMMSLSMVYIAGFSPLPGWAVGMVALLIAVGAGFILRCPHQLSTRTSGTSGSR